MACSAAQIRLESVRQFHMEDVVLSETSLDPDDPDVVRKTEAYCMEKVDALVAKAGASDALIERQIFKRATPVPRLRRWVGCPGGGVSSIWACLRETLLDTRECARRWCFQLVVEGLRFEFQ